jgi:hypothetical protein
MKDLQSNKYFFKIIAFSNIIFIILYSILSYYNRIAVDDFYFLAFLKEHGILGGAIVTYNTWSGRWVSSLLNAFVISFYPFKYFLFVYGLLVFALFIYSVKRCIHNLKKIFRWDNINFWKELHIAIFIVSAFFYSTIKIDETWFWLCSTCVFLLSMILFFLGTSALIAIKGGVFNTLLIMISFTLIGGSSEPFALTVLLLLLLFGLANFFDMINFNLPQTFLNKRFYIAFICCLTSFVFLYSAEGNRVRESFFAEISIWYSFFLNIKTTGMIIVLRLPLIIPFVILFSIPAYYLGYLNSTENINKKIIKLRIAFIMILYFASIYIYQLPITYITQDIGAYRTLFPITFFSLLAGFGIFYNLGLGGLGKSSRVHSIVLFSLIAVCCLNTYSLISQLIILPKYAEAYDKRIVYLNKNKANINPIIIEPLPESGLLYSAEISTDSSYFTNQHLKKGLGLKSVVIVSRINK